MFKLMVDYCAKPIMHDAFHKKYARKKYLKGKSTSPPNEFNINHLSASLLVRQWAKKYYSVYFETPSHKDDDPFLSI